MRGLSALLLGILVAQSTAALELTASFLAASIRDVLRPRDHILSPDGQTLRIADLGDDVVKALDREGLARFGTIGDGELRARSRRASTTRKGARP